MSSLYNTLGRHSCDVRHLSHKSAVRLLASGVYTARCGTTADLYRANRLGSGLKASRPIPSNGYVVSVYRAKQGSHIPAEFIRAQPTR